MDFPGGVCEAIRNENRGYRWLQALGTLAIAQQSHAASCVNGVYRAGCDGPKCAPVVRKP